MSPQGTSSLLCRADSLHRNSGGPKRTAHSWGVGEQTRHPRRFPGATLLRAPGWELLWPEGEAHRSQAILDTWVLILRQCKCGVHELEKGTARDTE